MPKLELERLSIGSFVKAENPGCAFIFHTNKQMLVARILRLTQGVDEAYCQLTLQAEQASSPPIVLTFALDLIWRSLPTSKRHRTTSNTKKLSGADS